MTSHLRAHLIITGRVQGVCFRYETLQTAEGLGVDGWVRNLPDGTVEALIEGAGEAVEAAIRWCHSGPALSRVDDVQVVYEKYQGDLSGFRIR